MGGGFYCATNSATRSMEYSTKTRSEIFSKRTIDNKMDPKGLRFREARDSDNHPNSIPIIVALDETGSMGFIPEEIVKGGLAKIMGNIIQNGIPDPQVLFLGIGDHECDNHPVQVGQFESADEELDQWLTSVYLEGGGGGNTGESYMLAWYIAARFTETDQWDKRKKKGLLFTIGDEPVLPKLPASAQLKIMGNGKYKDVTSVELLKEAQEKYEVYHLHIVEGSWGRLESVKSGWKQLLGENCIIVDDYKKVPTIIAQIVAKSQGVKDVNIIDDVNELARQEKESTKVDSPWNV